MSEEQIHATFVEECMKTRKEAEQYLEFRNALSPDNPKARFPGFYQRVTVFRKGQQVKPGARPLPIDIVMHESVPMILSDGIKIYCDIFLRANLPQDLRQQVDEKDRVPALVAWYVIFATASRLCQALTNSQSQESVRKANGHNTFG
jgi:hypothetical protein